MFRAKNLAILRSTFSYNAPTLLPTDAMVEVELHLNRGIGRQQRRYIVPKLYIYSQKVLLRMAEFVARNILG